MTQEKQVYSTLTKNLSHSSFESLPLSLYPSFPRILSPVSFPSRVSTCRNPVISYLLIAINHLIHHLAFQS
jgi:hypothetical protein